MRTICAKITLAYRADFGADGLEIPTVTAVDTLGGGHFHVLV